LRRVAARLIKPRSQWPADELVARCAATANDITVIDRRLRDLDPAGRQLLALVGHSRQPQWGMGSLVELLIALGHEDGLAPVLAVLWQQVASAPLRLTQQGELFKRDLDRLGQDPLLNAPSAEGLPSPPDAGLLAVALGVAAGILHDGDGELRAGDLPAAWEDG